MIIMTPSDENECRQMLYTGYKCGKPAAVRYPRGNAIGVELTPLAELEIGRSKMVRQGEKIAILEFWYSLTCCFICGRKTQCDCCRYALCETN